MTSKEILDVIKPYLKDLVREALREILSQSSSPSGLMKPKDAIAHLGYDTVDALYSDITAGLLRVKATTKSGEIVGEVIDIRRPGAQVARWRVDVPACLKRFAEDPEKRRSA